MSSTSRCRAGRREDDSVGAWCAEDDGIAGSRLTAIEDQVHIPHSASFGAGVRTAMSSLPARASTAKVGVL